MTEVSSGLEHLTAGERCSMDLSLCLGPLQLARLEAEAESCKWGWGAEVLAEWSMSTK